MGSLLATTFSVHANGLGDISVKSHLGERLRVEIQLRGNENSPRGRDCFHLSNALAEHSDLPRLSHASLNVLTNPPRLAITSRDSLFEPAIELAVFYGCGVYLSRSYTVLLSPREAIQPISLPQAVTGANEIHRATSEPKGPAPVVRRTRQLLSGETPAEMAQRLYPRSENYRKRFLRELIALNPDKVSDATIDRPLPEGGVLKIPPPIVSVKKSVPAPAPETLATVAGKLEPAPPPAKAPTEKTDRLVLSAPPEEPLGTLPQVTPDQAQIEMDQRLRDIIGQSRTLNAEIASLQREFPNPPAELQTRLLEMETRLARMELAAVRIKLSAAQAQPSAVTPQTAISSTAAAEVAAAAPSAAPNSSPVTTPATPPAVPEPAAEKSAPAKIESSGFWWELGVLLALATALAVYLARNSTRRGGGPLSTLLPMKWSLPPIESDGDIPARPVISSTAEQPIAAAPVDELDRPVIPHEFERSMPGEIEIVEVAHVLAIFGRTQSAIDVLSEFITQNPDKVLNPSLYLLKLYKQTDKRDDFKSLAVNLHTKFNVLEISWDDPIEEIAPVESSSRDYRDMARELEKIPHIYSRISEQWGSQECLDYLHNLLHDNRSGQRSGLPLAATKEVLNLLAVLQRELSANSDRT